MFEEQLLDPKRHDRSGFACGEPALDAFLQRHAHQNMRKGISQTWVRHLFEYLQPLTLCI